MSDEPSKIIELLSCHDI